jgi:hypothetical protein
MLLIQLLLLLLLITTVEEAVEVEGLLSILYWKSSPKSEKKSPSKPNVCDQKKTEEGLFCLESWFIRMACFFS